VSLQEVDGGPDYYARFSHPLPNVESYFPIGVWLESVTSQADVDKDRDVGLNLYVTVTANSRLPLISANGLRVIAQQSEWRTRGQEAGADAIAGWELYDEIDMVLGPEAGYPALEAILALLPDDGRLHYNNYGKGVAFWETNAEAARFVNDFQDIVSADTYWFTDPNICSRTEGGALLAGGDRALAPAECRRAANYGATVARVRDLVSPPGSKPVWAFVEVGHPFTESHAPSIQPAEVRAAVWQSLIAGARGIIYFNHSFGGPYQSQHVLRDPNYAPIRAAVRATNRQIADLAFVLNAPTVISGWSQGPGTTGMVKWANGHFYVLGGSAGSAVSGRFSLPCVGDASATVLNEGRSIPVTGGSFNDSFADANAIHIYRIDGGSSCGLLASPSNEFSFGRLKRNLSKGWARLAVRVPSAGELRLKKTRRVRTASRPATEAGRVWLRIRPRGKARRKLELVRTGRGAGQRKRVLKARVTAKVVYTPAGGEPRTRFKDVRLKRRQRAG
jgi:hypothetical protein